MARITWQEYLNLKPPSKPKPSKFWLKEDGDSAIIRFGINDVDELKAYRVHSVFMNGRYQDVECLRKGEEDDISLCPYCEKKLMATYKIYIPILSYELGDDGKWVAKPKIWDQKYSFKETLKFNQDNYGPLIEKPFKVIKKAPIGGKIEYVLMTPNDKLYKPEYFEDKDFSCFNNFSIYNYILMEANKVTLEPTEGGNE